MLICKLISSLFIGLAGQLPATAPGILLVQFDLSDIVFLVVVLSIAVLLINSSGGGGGHRARVPVRG